MTKEEFIARYGEEAYAKKLEDSRQAHKQRYEDDPDYYKKISERNKEARDKWRKEHVDSVNAQSLKRYKEKIATDPTFRDYVRKVAEKRKEKLKSIMGDAYDFTVSQISMMNKHPTDDLDKYILENLAKEAAEVDGDSRLVNEDFLYDCFVDNCQYGLFFGNLVVLKYFVPLMCIKVHKGIEFSDKDIEMIKVFDGYKNTLNKRPISYSFKMYYIRPDQRDDVDMNMKCMLLYNLSANFMHNRNRYETDKKLY